MKKNRVFRVVFLALVCLLFSGMTAAGSHKVYADGAGDVEITKIDYDDLTMTVNPNGNSVVSYSKDKKNWYELEYFSDGNGGQVMDISWLSATAATKVYLKGDKNTKVVTVNFPKRNTALKVKFDKANGILTIEEYEDAEEFEWRKTTDYTWNRVSLDESDATHQAFKEDLESLRVKGGKIIVRTPSVAGTSVDDTGSRSSKEVTVSITKRSNAPSVTINVKKLTLNTTVKQEYSINEGLTWKECDKTMELSDLLPQVLLTNGNAMDGVLWIRTAATDKVGYSKTQIIPVAAQRTVPNTFAYYFESNKLVLQFTDAAKTVPYEYFIQKPGYDFDPSKASWKSVTSNRVIRLSQRTAPEGSVVYYRSKGVNANKSKGIAAILPSAYASMVVNYPAQ